MAKLRLYADFNDCDGDVCLLLRYAGRPLAEQENELGLRHGMSVVVYYEDPGEEFEFDAVLEHVPDASPSWTWRARIDESSYRLIRETSLEELRSKGIIP